MPFFGWCCFVDWLFGSCWEPNQFGKSNPVSLGSLVLGLLFLRSLVLPLGWWLPSTTSSSFSGGSPPPSPLVVVCPDSPLAAVHTRLPRLGVPFLPLGRGFATSSLPSRESNALSPFGGSSSPSPPAVAPPRFWVWWWVGRWGRW